MAERARPITQRREPAPPTGQDVAGWQGQLRRAMFEALDPEAVRDIVTALVAKAKQGDLQAARLLLTYAVGSPTVHVKNAVIVNEQPAPLPTPPSKATPGSDLRLVDLATRADRGLPLHDPRDAGFGEDD